jgi:hypothetical protein
MQPKRVKPTQSDSGCQSDQIIEENKYVPEGRRTGDFTRADVQSIEDHNLQEVEEYQLLTSTLASHAKQNGGKLPHIELRPGKFISST